MSPLRKQMQDDRGVRGRSPRTLESSVGAVAALAKHYRRSPDRISAQEVQRIFQRARARAGITKDRGIHGLGHAFAPHLLEAGVDVPTIQPLMGHGHIGSTLRYFPLARKHLGQVPSPLDILPRPEPRDGK